MVKVDVVLICGRTTEQGTSLEIGKSSDEYFKSVAVVELNKVDMETLDVDEGERVEVSTPHGNVVVKCKVLEGLSPGQAFMPYGPWANQLIGSYTGGTGMPSLKNVRATIVSASGRDIPTLDNLVQALRGERR